MFAFLRHAISAGHRKSAFYYASQIFVLATPFLIIPFLARVVGPVGLGLYGIGQAIALVVSTLVDYGFQINGARRVAQDRDNALLLRSMVADAFAAKLVVSVICLAIGPIILAFAVSDRSEFLLFVLSIVLGVLQGNNLYWYLGGVDRLFIAGMIDLVAKSLALVGIFILVRGEQDLWLVFVAQIASQFVAVALSAGLVWKQYGAGIIPRWRKGLVWLRANFEVTARSMVSFLYVGSTVLIMSFLAGPESVGYFSGAERIIRGAFLPMTPLRQTFFPTISAKVARDRGGAVRDVRRLLYITVAINFLIMLIFLVAAEPIVRIALGPRFAPSVEVLRILSIWPLLTGIAEVVGTLWLLPLHFDRTITKIVIITAVVHVVAVFLFSYLWLYIGAALAMEISAAVAIVMFGWVAATKTPLFRGFSAVSQRRY